MSSGFLHFNLKIQMHLSSNFHFLFQCFCCNGRTSLHGHKVREIPVNPPSIPRKLHVTDCGSTTPTQNTLNKGTGGTGCLSHTPGSHSVCAVKTSLGIKQKIPSISRDPMLSEDFLRVSSCLAVVAQWQSTGNSSQRCPGFNSWRLPAFSLYFS